MYNLRKATSVANVPNKHQRYSGGQIYRQPGPGFVLRCRSRMRFTAGDFSLEMYLNVREVMHPSEGHRRQDVTYSLAVNATEASSHLLS